MILEPTGRRYTRTPEAQPPGPPVVDDEIWARITGNSPLGSGRWSYTFAEADKTAAAYGGWSTVDGGRTGTCYNATEDVANAVSGPLANGTPVYVREVTLAGQAAPEYWIVAVDVDDLLALASSPSNGQVPQYDAPSKTWIPTDPSTLLAQGADFNLVISHFIRFNQSVATQEVTISDTDFRDTIIKVESWATAANTDPPGTTVPWGKSSGASTYLPPALFWIDAAPGADMILMEWGSLDLILDKDDGKLKWSYHNASPFHWGLCNVWVRNSTTPDVVVTS